MPRLPCFLFVAAEILCSLAASAQIDPVRREMVQLGYNQSLVGHAPLAGYAFYYRNQPNFLQTNLTLRLAIAPVYLDTELGIQRALGERTDLGIGLAGGGFADSYAEIRKGKYLRAESFTGHGGEMGVSLYHCFIESDENHQVPLNGILRAGFHYSAFERDDETDVKFEIPDDQQVFHFRTGLRWGGKEPVLFPSLAMELSLWYEGQVRFESQRYGRMNDREIKPQSHLFWARALFAYTQTNWMQSFYISITAGTSVEADRFSAYRLGALLPLVSEFPLSLPGYYYQEISAERFVLVGGNYSVALDSKNRWSLNGAIATAVVDYLPGLEQPGHWHTGLGAGVMYRSPSGTLKVLAGYAYGVDAIRTHGRGAHSVGLLMQIDLEHARSLYYPEAPGRWRGLQRIFGS